jgi:hypothetical protein
MHFLRFSTYMVSVLLGCLLFGPLNVRAETEDPEEVMIRDQENYDSSVPYAEHFPSHWAVALRVALHNFPMSRALGDIYQLQGEYLLPFQKAGVFGLGAHLGVLNFHVSDRLPNDPRNFGAGVHFRYLLRFMKNQLFVPTAALELTMLRIRGVDDQGWLTTSNFGVSLGVMLSLGFFDQKEATEGYLSSGLKRSYLTLEMRPQKISDPTIEIDGTSYFMGLRLEF